MCQPDKHACDDPFCRGLAEHAAEAERISRELAALGDEFSEEGIVRTVLRERIEQERGRSR